MHSGPCDGHDCQNEMGGGSCYRHRKVEEQHHGRDMDYSASDSKKT